LSPATEGSEFSDGKFEQALTNMLKAKVKASRLRRSGEAID
jgi:hypothetical protein